jgi:glutamate-1-semialdehyde 2,1-aminomutase
VLKHTCIAASSRSAVQIFTEAKDLMPGGVNSPVRAFNSVGGQPVVFDRVKGALVYDVDGNEYIDYVGTWGPAIVGHANVEVLDAIKSQLDKGARVPCPLICRDTVIDSICSVVCAAAGVAASLRADRASYWVSSACVQQRGCAKGHSSRKATSPRCHIARARR